MYLGMVPLAGPAAPRPMAMCPDFPRETWPKQSIGETPDNLFGFQAGKKREISTSSDSRLFCGELASEKPE